jgi:hypothetical protein
VAVTPIVGSWKFGKQRGLFKRHLKQIPDWNKKKEKKKKEKNKKSAIGLRPICPWGREVQKMYFWNLCIKIEKENTKITNGA